MLVSRKLAHRIHSRLQVILGLVELGRIKEAVTSIHELADLVDRHTQTERQERACQECEADSI